jgi:ribosome-associated protein
MLAGVPRKRLIDTSVPEEHEEVGPSRTRKRAARKRTQADLDAMTQRLSELAPRHLPHLGLDPLLLEELGTLERTPRGNGLVRQRRRIAGLLRAYDLEALGEKVEELAGASGPTAQTHRLERWRTRLLDEGDGGLAEFLAEYPAADRQRLRHAIRAAVTEAAGAKSMQHRKKLFRLLKEIDDRSRVP